MVNDFLDKSGIMALWNRAKSIFITAENPTATTSITLLNADLLDGHPGSYYLQSDIDVVDNLTSTSTSDALSANQGRVLSGNIASVISSIPNTIDNLTSTSTGDALSANQGRVLNNSIIALSPVDDLTSTSTTAPLSANQGKVLKTAIDSLPIPVDNLTSTSTTAPLSANQGKVLNETKPGLVTTRISGNDTFIGEIFNSYTGAGQNTASGNLSHAEGYGTTASGNNSHAEGYNATASGYISHAEGNFTAATHKAQHVFGEYNIRDNSLASSDNRGTYIEIVGNGTNDALSNARTLDWSGNEVLAGKLTVGTAPTNNMDVATKQYVDNSLPPIVNNLNSSSTTSGLSANQGRLLSETKAPIASPSFTGTATVASGTDYTTAKLRNVILSTNEPTASDGADGDIWIVYTAE